MCSGKKLYLGDFNVLIDLQNNVDASNFRGTLVIDSVKNSIIGNVHVEPQNSISYHMVVNFKNFVDDIPKNK